MIRQTIIAVLFVCFVSTSSVLAGMWRDDFEDGNLDGWEGVNQCWTIEKGECSGEKFDPNSGDIIWMGDAGWKDCTVRCKMKFVDARAPNGRAGIVFRHIGMDNSNLYAFLINADAKTAWGAKVLQGVGVMGPGISDVPLPFALSKDIWYELKIIVEGDNFEFYIDENPAGEFKDKSIPSGKVGLCIVNAHAHFDDLIISGEGVGDGGSWDPAKHPEEKAVEPKGKLAMMWGEIKSK